MPFLGESTRTTWSALLREGLNGGCLLEFGTKVLGPVTTADAGKPGLRPSAVVVEGDAGQDWGKQNYLGAVPGLLGLVSAAANVRSSLGFPLLALLNLEHKPSCFHSRLEGFTVQLPLEMLERGEGAQARGPCSPYPLSAGPASAAYEENIRFHNTQLSDNLPVGEISFKPLAGISGRIS